jgi:hypothetical protein
MDHFFICDTPSMSKGNGKKLFNESLAQMMSASLREKDASWDVVALLSINEWDSQMVGYLQNHFAYGEHTLIRCRDKLYLAPCSYPELVMRRLLQTIQDHVKVEWMNKEILSFEKDDGVNIDLETGELHFVAMNEARAVPLQMLLTEFRPMLEEVARRCNAALYIPCNKGRWHVVFDWAGRIHAVRRGLIRSIMKSVKMRLPLYSKWSADEARVTVLIVYDMVDMVSVDGEGEAVFGAKGSGYSVHDFVADPVFVEKLLEQLRLEFGICGQAVVQRTGSFCRLVLTS